VHLLVLLRHFVLKPPEASRRVRVQANYPVRDTGTPYGVQEVASRAILTSVG